MSISQKKDFVTWINDKASALSLADVPNLADFIYDSIDKKTRFSFDERKDMAEICIEVVGTQYEGRSGRIENLSAGSSVNLVREPKNEYNANNISVQNKSGQSLGNLPADLADVLSPLLDAGEAKIEKAKVDYVEPLSKRSARAKKAILYVSFFVKLEKVDFSKASGCTVCILGGDQVHGWFQTLKVLHCKMDIAQAKLIFELYNRSCDEYNPENNDLGYQGLDNLVDEVIVARQKMRSEMESGVDYSGPSEDIEERIDFIQEQIKKNPKRYSSIKKYIENCADDYAIIECVFESDSIGEENYYWIDQSPVTEQEYNSETGWGFNHWYEVAELFEAGELPFDLTDEDTVSIFGTNKFVAFADLSYGC